MPLSAPGCYCYIGNYILVTSYQIMFPVWLATIFWEHLVIKGSDAHICICRNNKVVESSSFSVFLETREALWYIPAITIYYEVTHLVPCNCSNRSEVKIIIFMVMHSWLIYIILGGQADKTVRLHTCSPVGDDLTGGGTVRVCEKGRGTLRSGRQATWTTNASS